MKYALVVDLGATNFRIAIVNDNHEIVKKIKTSTDKNVDIAFKIYTEYKNLDVNYDLTAVVVGVPGSINFKGRIIRDLPNIKMNEYDLESAPM